MLDTPLDSLVSALKNLSVLGILDCGNSSPPLTQGSPLGVATAGVEWTQQGGGVWHWRTARSPSHSLEAAIPMCGLMR